MAFLAAAVIGWATGYGITLISRRGFQVTNYWRAAYAWPFAVLVVLSIGLAQWFFLDAPKLSWQIGQWVWAAGILVWAPAIRRAYQSRAKITNHSYRTTPRA